MAGEFWGIVGLSLRVTGLALLLSAALGVPCGAWLGLRRFAGRRAVIALLYTGMGLPPVVVGLTVYLLLARQGPLGFLGWLFTPAAMVLAQTIIAFPVIAGLTMASVLAVSPELAAQLRTLGAQPAQVLRAYLNEARGGIAVALVAGFGSIISEVGAVLLVGGNVRSHTRVLTTAIVLETSQGEFGLALALGMALLGITFVINALALHLQSRFAEI
ncbi:MAG: ABC transporter permease [Armatimonadetes bacterium]|nr:ABC transporter permease [Armatimonadota bacterium]